MSRRSRGSHGALVVGLGVCFVLVTATRGLAQASGGAEPAGYAALIDEAVSEIDMGHFAEARALFARAHALYPNARTLRGLGMVEFELRDYVASTQALEQALASEVKPLSPELRSATEQLLQRARGYVGRVVLRTEPSSAEVLVDGTRIEAGTGTLSLNMGEHTVVVRAEGRSSETRTVTLRGGEEVELAVALAPAVAEVSAPSTAPSTAPEHADTGSAGGPGAWPWVVVATGGAMMVGGGVLLVLWQGDVSEVEDASEGARWSRESQDAFDAAPLESGAGFALLGVGAVSVTLGLLWALGSDEPESARAGFDGRRLTLRGRF